MTQKSSFQKIALHQLPEPIQNILSQRTSTELSFLPADLVTLLLEASGLDKAQLGLALMALAKSYAVTPVSNFNVGAIGFDSDGNAYLGANFEFADTHIGQTIHAEQSVIAHMWQRGAKDLALLVINYPPCGHCRQFINEVKLADDFLIQLPESHAKPLSYYLPDAFSGKDLGIEEQILGNTSSLALSDTGILSQEEHNKQSIENNQSSQKTDDLTVGKKLLELATNAHDTCHAPYSNNKNGIALLYNNNEVSNTNNYEIITGRYAENAAFNPTLPALQVALNYRRMQGKDWKSIKRIILVESVSTLSQYNNTASLLATMTSEIKLEHLKK